jgi:periplasmic copper chaperone A
MFRFVLVAAFAAIGTPAWAHITLERGEAAVASSYKAVLKVPHGCKGSPTTAVRVKIPAGLIAVKPMPKPGWAISMTRGKYEKTYEYFHNAKLSEGVVELGWSGGSLPDEHYDEFVFQGFLAGDLKPETTLYFPIVQECAEGVHRWIEIPAGGKPADDLESPAPGLRLLPRR